MLLYWGFSILNINCTQHVCMDIFFSSLLMTGAFELSNSIIAQIAFVWFHLF
jgi:hypothetical protein